MCGDEALRGSLLGKRSEFGIGAIFERSMGERMDRCNRSMKGVAWVSAETGTTWFKERQAAADKDCTKGRIMNENLLDN